MFKGLTIFSLVCLLLTACQSSRKNRFTDKTFIRIADFQDRALSDSLYPYLTHPRAEYRAAAALAFASIQDSAASPKLGSLLLEDEDSLVRMNAAFSLGQTGGFAAVNALLPRLQDKNSFVAFEVLQATGKTVGKQDLDALKRYKPHDSITQAGLAWACFRLGVRKMADSTIVEREIEFLSPSNTMLTREGAANFFARSNPKGTRFENALISASLSDASPEVRMSAISGLRKLKSDAVLTALGRIIKEEPDYRVRVSAVRTLAGFDLTKTKTLFVSALNDNQVNVGICASEVIANSLTTSWPELLLMANKDKRWRVQANLYKAILKTMPSSECKEAAKRAFSASENPYQQAALLSALGASADQHAFISSALLKATSPVVKTAAAEALVTMNYEKAFQDSGRPVFLGYYKSAIEDGDLAVIGLVCGAIGDSTLGYKKEITNLSFLYDARDKMKLPGDFESLQPVLNAIAYLEGRKKPALLTNGWNHPIDWSVLTSLSGSERVRITTSRGQIRMRLLPDEAPGSVANFIALARSHYFDGKYVHRTVPNFVIQTGCKRGDGYGGENYSIRSEFSKRRYSEGTVGMASAGKNTEGTQWFITHSATPHLDGRYSVFAEVISGMDVVNELEVGDQIGTVEIGSD